MIWEYACLNWVPTATGKDYALRSGADIEIVVAVDLVAALNQVGAKGWEVISIQEWGRAAEPKPLEGEAYLKRPVPDAPRELKPLVRRGS